MPVLDAPAPARDAGSRSPSREAEVLTCPGCGAEVRLPRHDGGHSHPRTRKALTCPACGTDLQPGSEETERTTWRRLAWRRVA